MQSKGKKVLLSIVVICMLCAIYTYYTDTSKEPGTNVSTESNLNEVTMKENSSYDTSVDFYEEYDNAGLQRFAIVGIYTDVENYVKEVREMGYCEYVYEAYEGTQQQIIVEMTEEQRLEWISVLDNTIQEVLDGIDEEQQFMFSVADECTVLSARVSTDAVVEDYMSALTVLLFNLELHQIFSGNEDWAINIITKDWETDSELSNIDFPTEDYHLSLDMWEE